MTSWRNRASVVLAALFLANLLGYAARNSLFMAYGDLRAVWPVDDSALGLLTTVYIAGQALATLPMGWLGDRWGRRKILVLGLGLASLAGLVGGFVSSIWALAFCRAVVGIGTAAIVPVGNSVLGQVFPGGNKASRIALFNMGLFAGGAIGMFGGAVLGFPAIVWSVAVAMAALALLLPVMEFPAHALRESEHSLEMLAAERMPDVMARMLRIRALRWLIASAIAMAFAAGGLQSWLGEFLMRVKLLSKEDANLLMAVVLVAALLGVIVGGKVGDDWRRREPAGRAKTIVVSMAAAMPLIMACLYVPGGLPLFVLGPAAMFMLSWYHAPMAATVDDLVPRALSVRAQAVVLFAMHLLGTAPASWAVGKLSTHLGLGVAMWVPATAIGIAAVCMVGVVRTYPAPRSPRPGWATPNARS